MGVRVPPPGEAHANSAESEPAAAGPPPHAAGPMIDPRGENIPLFARIVALADVYDALVTPRAYKKAWSVAEALEAIRAEAGRQFDPELAELMPDVIHRREARMRTEAA